MSKVSFLLVSKICCSYSQLCHNINPSNIYLSNIHLSNIHLSNIHLSNMHLSNIHLSNIHLSNIYLSNIHPRKAYSILVCVVFWLFIMLFVFFFMVKHALYLQVILSTCIMWCLCYMLTAAGGLPEIKGEYGYEARTDLRLAVIGEVTWFRFPYPGM